jgi:hypothetical protein
MAEFPTWGWLELKITVGEAVTAISALTAAWWVGSIIQKRHAADRAIRELVLSLAADSVDLLGSVSDTLESACPAGGAPVDEAVRRKITRSMQRFSNSIHTIEIAATEAKLIALSSYVQTIKDNSETLRSFILDPLAAGPGLDGVDLRQIHGAILKARESLVRLQLKAMAS